MDPNLVEQLQRQSLWLRDSWLWLLRERVTHGARMSALEVGCGAGHVMEILSEHLDVKGIDRDPDMVAICREKKLDVTLAEAGNLPFPNGTFDIVYCSYLMLWLGEPVKAIREMSRVSGKWVVCLAEPDYGARIDYPPQLEGLGKALAADLRSKGADPFIGRKLRSVFSAAGLDAEIGVHQGVWPLEKTAREVNAELERAGEPAGGDLKYIAEQAMKDGGLLQYNPVFYALAKK